MPIIARAKFATAILIGVTLTVSLIIAKAPVPKSRTAGEEITVQINETVAIVLCWIPPGEAALGCPDNELKGVFPTESEIPSLLLAERHSSRGSFKTEGFWMSKHEITQSQWTALENHVRSNAFYFSPTGKGKKQIEGQVTGNYPADTISWDDAIVYISELNKLESFKKVGKAMLPDENQWEYACRGGSGNTHAYYFGKALDGRQANCAGSIPFGTNNSGPFLQRTTQTASYAEQYPHPWGLCDMHGNVREWCDGWYDAKKKTRPLRGGSWIDQAMSCRSASRTRQHPETATESDGFRIIIVPR